VYEGLETSLSFVEQTLVKEAPIDGLIGYSQGAMFCAALSAKAALGQFPSLKFVALFCGMKPRAAILQSLFEKPIDVRSFHLLAKRDQMHEASRKLTEFFVDPCVVEIDCGHTIPKTDDFLSALSEFIVRFEQQ